MARRDWLTILIEVRLTTPKKGVDPPMIPPTEPKSALLHPAALGRAGRDALPNQSTS